MRRGVREEIRHILDIASRFCYLYISKNVGNADAKYSYVVSFFFLLYIVSSHDPKSTC